MSKADDAKRFFKQVESGANEHLGIPDPALQQKIRRVKEGAGEVVKHIEERTDPKKG